MFPGESLKFLKIRINDIFRLYVSLQQENENVVISGSTAHPPVLRQNNQVLLTEQYAQVTELLDALAIVFEEHLHLGLTFQTVVIYMLKQCAAKNVPQSLQWLYLSYEQRIVQGSKGSGSVFLFASTQDLMRQCLNRSCLLDFVDFVERGVQSHLEKFYVLERSPLFLGDEHLLQFKTLLQPLQLVRFLISDSSQDSLEKSTTTVKKKKKKKKAKKTIVSFGDEDEDEEDLSSPVLEQQLEPTVMKYQEKISISRNKKSQSQVEYEKKMIEEDEKEWGVPIVTAQAAPQMGERSIIENLELLDDLICKEERQKSQQILLEQGEVQPELKLEENMEEIRQPKQNTEHDKIEPQSNESQISEIQPERNQEITSEMRPQVSQEKILESELQVTPTIYDDPESEIKQEIVPELNKEITQTEVKLESQTELEQLEEKVEEEDGNNIREVSPVTEDAPNPILVQHFCAEIVNEIEEKISAIIPSLSDSIQRVDTVHSLPISTSSVQQLVSPLEDQPRTIISTSTAEPSETDKMIELQENTSPREEEKLEFHVQAETQTNFTSEKEEQTTELAQVSSTQPAENPSNDALSISSQTSDQDIIPHASAEEMHIELPEQVLTATTVVPAQDEANVQDTTQAPSVIESSAHGSPATKSDLAMLEDIEIDNDAKPIELPVSASFIVAPLIENDESSECDLEDDFHFEGEEAPEEIQFLQKKKPKHANKMNHAIHHGCLFSVKKHTLTKLTLEQKKQRNLFAVDEQANFEIGQQLMELIDQYLSMFDLPTRDMDEYRSQLTRNALRIGNLLRRKAFRIRAKKTTFNHEFLLDLREVTQDQITNDQFTKLSAWAHDYSLRKQKLQHMERLLALREEQLREKEQEIENVRSNLLEEAKKSQQSSYIPQAPLVEQQREAPPSPPQSQLTNEIIQQLIEEQSLIQPSSSSSSLPKQAEMRATSPLVTPQISIGNESTASLSNTHLRSFNQQEIISQVQGPEVSDWEVVHRPFKHSSGNNESYQKSSFSASPLSTNPNTDDEEGITEHYNDVSSATSSLSPPIQPNATQYRAPVKLPDQVPNFSVDLFEVCIQHV